MTDNPEAMLPVTQEGLSACRKAALSTQPPPPADVKAMVERLRRRVKAPGKRKPTPRELEAATMLETLYAEIGRAVAVLNEMQEAGEKLVEYAEHATDCEWQERDCICGLHFRRNRWLAAIRDRATIAGEGE